MGAHVIAVVGATATGKSGLAVELARALGGEIVNADSMQLYQGMDIGTAKEPEAARQGVPHHLLDIWPVTQAANVADYAKLARAAIDEITARGRVPILGRRLRPLRPRGPGRPGFSRNGLGYPLPPGR